MHPEDQRVRFEAFRKWIGPSIERTEGYYFRHDSQENPNFKEASENFTRGKNSPQKILQIHPLMKSYQHLKTGRAEQSSDHTDVLVDFMAKVN